MRHEMRDFEAAFRKYNLQTKLTVVVVQKRITNRLFWPCPRKSGGQCPLRKCDGTEDYHSPPPGPSSACLTACVSSGCANLLLCLDVGVVVNQAIASQEFRDFFLVPSIAPPNATARPTRQHSLALPLVPLFR